jgi:glyceraldehyde-3-phosphate dehydrogenase/erythrose-4-phosphate dehydrogenase
VFNIVAIHDLADGKALAHLLKWDSVYRLYNEPVSFQNGKLVVGDHEVICLGERTDPKVCAILVD